MTETTKRLAAACLLLPATVLAQTAGQPRTGPVGDAVVITATRAEARAFDVPASIDRVDVDDFSFGRPQVNISETLALVPGLIARDRQNYAQDVQISVRGFGARSTFGIRGVRLYVDGIPGTQPDGQGQITNVDLGSAERIEVLRGPYSALYGNSSGGVIQVFTEEGRGPPRIEFGVSAGSDDASRVAVKAAGAVDGVGYVVSASRFETDGWRQHSAARREIGNAKLTLRPDADSRLTLIANHVALPSAQDPQGLSRAQFEADPRGVNPTVLTFDTRKSLSQTQGGAIYERRIDGANRLQVTAYGGQREIEQFLSIPTAPQASPLHPGGVIDLDRDYHGIDLRWTWRSTQWASPLSIVGGVDYQSLDEHRRGYQNFVGNRLGVVGALRRDENNDATSVDPYVQASWQIAPKWLLNAGLRHSRIDFTSADRYVVGANPDDSGSASFSATLPVVGIMYAASERVHVYANAGRGFETPTLNELAYRSDGTTGLNLALRDATSENIEVGIKTRSAAWGELDAAVFATRTDREIVTATSAGGRSTFRNAGTTRRTGVEIGWSKRLASDLRAQAAYTWLDARYRDGFGTIPSDNRIPGIPRQSFAAALDWKPATGWRGGVEARAVGRVYVDDANSDSAAGYAIASAHAGYVVESGPWSWGGYVRVDNLFDRDAIGSIIVNDGNGRYFEPAPGRTWLAGISATRRF